MAKQITLSIDDRIKRINETTDQLKAGFMVIATEMAAIKDQMANEGKTNSVFLGFMLEQTGYKRAMVYKFLAAHEAMGNIIDFSTTVENFRLPEAEWQIRPLATKKLNADPELQAEIWEAVVRAAGDSEITIDFTHECKKLPEAEW